MDKLEELNKRIQACTRCELREGATQPVCGLGYPGAKFFIIGEAPGYHEDKAGIPFIGDAGKKLDKLVALAGIHPNQIYLTNVCRCRPPKNKTPSKKFIRACKPWLMEELSIVKPEYIITLGSTPLSLFSEYGISQMHGTMFEVKVNDDGTITKV